MIYIATFTVAGYGLKMFKGADLSTVRSAWEAFRDQSGIGASDMSNGPVLLGNDLVGWMSYNGKIWPRREWQPGDVAVAA